MSHQVLWEITVEIHKVNFCMIIVDETTDCSNREQVILVLLDIDKKLSVHETFIGLYNIPSVDATTIVPMIKDSLQHLHLNIVKACGQ